MLPSALGSPRLESGARAGLLRGSSPVQSARVLADLLHPSDRALPSARPGSCPKARVDQMTFLGLLAGIRGLRVQVQNSGGGAIGACPKGAEPRGP